MRAALLVLALAACEQQHEVTLKLGPNDDTLSIGFRCKQQADPSKLLFERAPIRDGKLIVTVVVDLIDLGGRVLGCRGEEILSACEDGSCAVSVADNPVRFCHEVEVPIGNGDPAVVADNFRRLASGAVITRDAPDHPVIIRAIATTESCATIQQASDGIAYDPLDASLAVGCAYSCPVRLDDVDGTLYLSLDVLTDRCEQAVQQCAGAL